MNPGLHSHGLVESESLLRSVEGLASRFSTLQFLDLCALLEAIVLYDRLVVVGLPSNSLRDALSVLERNGILVKPPDQEANPPPATPSQRESLRKGTLGDYVRSGLDVPLDSDGANDLVLPTTADLSLAQVVREATRIYWAERKYGVSPVPLMSHRGFYEPAAQVEEQHTVCNLVAQYSELKDAIMEVRRHTRYPMLPYVQVPIPPVALEVLRRSRSTEDVLSASVDIRDEFAQLRSLLRTLRETLADENVPPLKKRRAIESWRKSWDSLQVIKRGAPQTVEFANAAAEHFNVNNAVGLEGLDSFRLDKLLQNLMSGSASLFHRWRIRILHKTSARFLRSADAELCDEVARVFGYRELATDIEKTSFFRKWNVGELCMRKS